MDKLVTVVIPCYNAEKCIGSQDESTYKKCLGEE